MRHRDDDLSPFRDDPVFNALTGPATEAELAGEAEAVSAFHAAVPVRRRRRSAARVAAGSSAAVVALGLSGGVAAAYTAELPHSWQTSLHKHLPALDIPAPHKSKPHPPAALATPPPSVAPVTPATPTTAPTGGGTPKPHHTSTSQPSPKVSPTATPSVAVVVPSSSSSSSPTATPSPTATQTQPPVAGASLTMSISPGNRVTVGTSLTVNGKLVADDGSAIANHRVVLAQRIVGQSGWQRVGGPLRTSSSGEVSFSVPSLQRNVRLVMRAHRHLRSTVQEVVVVPVIHVQVAPSAAGASSTTVSVSVTGGEPGDVVVVRQIGVRGRGQQATLDGSGSATFTVPVSQTRAIHYRVGVRRTTAHSAHSLPFYVPPSGSG
ncbi:MAG: hypothetical protein ACTHK4_02930 [Mycobacteriales bacterium]